MHRLRFEFKLYHLVKVISLLIAFSLIFVSIPPLAGALYINLGSLELNRALLLRKHEALEKAIVLFKQAINWNSGSGSAYHGLGQVYLAKNNAPAAAEVLTRAVGLNPRDTIAFFHLGKACEATGKKRDTLVAMAQAGYPTYFLQMAAKCCSSGNEEEVLEIYQLALELELDPYATYMALGQFYYDRGWWWKAEEPFRRAIAIDPESAWAHFLLGQVLSNKDTYQAINEYLVSLSLASDSGRVRLALGEAYYVSGQLAQAEAELRKALALDPDASWAARAHWSLGRVLATRDIKQAIEEYLIAIKLAPNTSYFHITLADAYYQNGQTLLAQTELRKALALDPGNRELQQKLDKLVSKESDEQEGHSE